MPKNKFKYSTKKPAGVYDFFLKNILMFILIVCLFHFLASFMKNVLQEKGSYSEFVKFTQDKRQQLVHTLMKEKKDVKGKKINNYFNDFYSSLLRFGVCCRYKR